MNCKQGDLAVLVKSLAGNEGVVVRCIKYVGFIEWLVGPPGHAWLIDRYLPVYGGGKSNRAPDSYLRPIRDSDKTDEIIERIGKPVKETT